MSRGDMQSRIDGRKDIDSRPTHQTEEKFGLSFPHKAKTHRKENHWCVQSQITTSISTKETTTTTKREKKRPTKEKDKQAHGHHHRFYTPPPQKK